MARDKNPGLFRCVEPFSVFKGGAPQVYGDGAEVFEDDPILRTHRSHFEPSSARVMRSRHIEQATAAPGQLRTMSTSPTLKTQERTSAPEQQ